MSTADKRLLAAMFSLQEPLGPIATPPALHERKHRKAFVEFFDAENFLCAAGKSVHPNIVLGRRGSGKTAYLYHLNFSNGFSFSSYIDTAAAFGEVSRKIAREIQDSAVGGDFVVETTAKAWKALLYTILLKAFWTEFHDRRGLKSTPEMAVITSFLEAQGLKRMRSIRSLLTHLRSAFEALNDVNLDFVQDFLDDYWWQDAGFGEAWEAATDLMITHEIRGALLLDSLEQFPIQEPHMADALAGLLHLIGQLHIDYGVPVEITLCFQAELHREFAKLSRNPEKDLQRVLTMHWDPGELLQICGHRLSVFLAAHRHRGYADIETLAENPTRAEVNAFWRQILPETLTNRFDCDEPSTAYILRHTQLLPRHMIAIFNHILPMALARPDPSLPIAAEDVLTGVRLGEESICQGILSGFENKYPQAQDVIDAVLPGLNNLSSFADLQRANNRLGKGIMSTDDMVDMLVRMGILGVFEQSTEIYDICRFDYTFNGMMPFSQFDRFGLHPAFAGQFGAQSDRSNDGSAKRPIYPKETFDEPRSGVSIYRV